MPHPIDLHVGAQIARRRIALGMNQSELGRALGITFQQVQKYEKASNRVSASKLDMAAKALSCTVADFFPEPGTEPGKPDGFWSLKGANALAKAFEAMPSHARKALVNTAEAMVPKPEPDGTGFDHLDDERDEPMMNRLVGDLHA